MSKVPGVVDLDSTLVDPVKPRPPSCRTSIAPALSASIRPTSPRRSPCLIGGVEASTFEDRGDQYPVFLRAAERFRNDPRRWR